MLTIKNEALKMQSKDHFAIPRISACGGSVTKNCTYVSNEDFPSTISGSALSCDYTVNYCK